MQNGHGSRIPASHGDLALEDVYEPQRRRHRHEPRIMNHEYLLDGILCPRSQEPDTPDVDRNCRVLPESVIERAVRDAETPLDDPEFAPLFSVLEAAINNHNLN